VIGIRDLRSDKPSSRQYVEHQILAIEGSAALGQKQYRKHWEKKDLAAGKRTNEVDTVYPCNSKDK
jgi:hypothetical protein